MLRATMGFLDDLRPATARPRPTEISVQADTPLLFLRARCPCAGCVDEWSGKRLLNVTTLRADIRPETLTEVGRYAVQVGWSDGHQTGIYSWELLRRLAEEHAAGEAA